MAKCSKEGCQYALTGVCEDGHPDDCPHLLSDSELIADFPPDDETDDSVKATSSRKSDERFFHAGEKLNLSEATHLLCARPVKMVLCVGGAKCGKTTFLARIGEMFRDGSFSKYDFAGSLTLCAFERATWKATIASGATRAETSRTLRKENDTFYHLTVCASGDYGTRRELLICDLAGETFSEYIASRELCARLAALQRADCVVAFIDCARIIDTNRRHTEIDNILQFLRQLGARQRAAMVFVRIVFSRWDYVTSTSKAKPHEEFCERFENRISKEFNGVFAKIAFSRVAARPDRGAPTNREIQGVFDGWLSDVVAAAQHESTRSRSPIRDFSAFGLV